MYSDRTTVTAVPFTAVCRDSKRDTDYDWAETWAESQPGVPLASPCGLAPLMTRNAN